MIDADLFAVAAHDEERVVDAQAQPENGDDVDHAFGERVYQEDFITSGRNQGQTSGGNDFYDFRRAKGQ